MTVVKEAKKHPHSAAILKKAAGVVMSAAALGPLAIDVHAQQAPVPAAPAAQPVMDQPAFPIQLRSLLAIADIRERPTPWQQAAQEAAGRVKDSALRNQVNQQLAAVGPQVAQDLLNKPGETAVVTVAVFKNPKTDQQSMAAVSYEGLGDSLNPSFFPRLLANVPNPASAKQQSDGRLELDAIATSYICFYLDHANLMAGDVPHTLMKKSLDVAIQQAREKGARFANTGSAGTTSQAQALAQQDLNQRIQAAREQQREIDAAAQTASAAIAPNYGNVILPMLPYGYSNYYGGYGWQPWIAYLPGEGAAPVVVKQLPPQQPGSDKDNTFHLGPNVPSARDPKTGQPLPPPIVRGDGTPVNNGATNGNNAGGNTGSAASGVNSAPRQAAPPSQAAPASSTPAQRSSPPPQKQDAAPRETPARSAPVEHQAQPQRSAPPAPARSGGAAGETPAKK